MFWGEKTNGAARRKASWFGLSISDLFTSSAKSRSRGKKRLRKGPRFTPGVEQLETRDVPAVTLSLSAGVLTVNGTTTNDSIVVRQLNGRVSVDGNTTSYAATAVNSLAVNAGAGNDSVNLQGLTTAWTKQITVRSEAGADSVRQVNGTTRTLTG